MHVTLQTIEPKTTFYTLPSIDFLYQTFSFLFTVETKKSEITSNIDEQAHL